MRRNALGHSREEYSAEGPSDRTIFRMENGQVHIKENTYRRLSRAMDEEESTRQGILQTEDISVLWLTNKIAGCLHTGNYEMAEEKDSEKGKHGKAYVPQTAGAGYAEGYDRTAAVCRTADGEQGQP